MRKEMRLWHCGNVRMWECGNVGMWECGNVRMWECENERMREWENERMREWENERWHVRSEKWEVRSEKWEVRREKREKRKEKREMRLTLSIISQLQHNDLVSFSLMAPCGARQTAAVLESIRYRRGSSPWRQERVSRTDGRLVIQTQYFLFEGNKWHRSISTPAVGKTRNLQGRRNGTEVVREFRFFDAQLESCNSVKCICACCQLMFVVFWTWECFLSLICTMKFFGSRGSSDTDK